MGVVREVRVFPLIAAAAPMTVGEYSCRWIQRKRHVSNRQKIRSATVADGFVRLPPNDGDLGNVPRAG